MAKIDQLLNVLRQRKADSLILTSGTPAFLKYGRETKPLTRQALNAAQIRALIGEIVDLAALQCIDAGKETRFRYVLADGAAFSCVAGHPGGTLLLSIAPATLASSDSPTAPIRMVPVSAGMSEPRVSLEPVPSDRFEIDILLRATIKLGGSDLHLSVGSRPVVRVDGTMTPIAESKAMSPEDTERILFPIMPDRNSEQFEAVHDTDFAYEIPDVARFRCNVFRDRHGTGGVFRLIPATLMTAEELGLSKEIQDLCFLTKGLVLVTGPTGSGKSTTLATLIDIVNRERTDHIITIEDPIEFVHTNKGCLVNQREVGVDTATFKSALRAALREDPDVVLVGEMRDLETIAIAIETAVTGHLVFATLHTSTAVQTVNRIIDQFPHEQQSQIRVMLADCLKGVIAQTLLKKKGGGRIAALEVLLGTPSVSNLIREGKTFQIPSVMQTNRGIGMVCLNEALAGLVEQGLVDQREAYAKAVDQAALVSLLERKEIRIDPSITERKTRPAPILQEVEAMIA